MKKIYILAAVALVASAACTKIETVDNTPGRPIVFQAANYAPQTKAVSVLPEFNSFQCKAFMHAQGVDLNTDGTVNGTSYQKFFGENGETISPNNTTAPTEWAPSSHTYYWPKGAQSFVNFVGWYGTDGTNAVNPTVDYTYTSSKWTATMTWNFTSTIGSTGSNLLYADMAWRYKENDDTPQYGVSTNVSEGVPMLFHHALAQINVKAYAEGTPSLTAGTGTVTDNTATWTITLKNVKITPVHKAGTLTLTNADPGTNTTQAWSGDWAGTDTAGDMARTDNYAVDDVTKNTAGDLIAATCVLPQTLGASVVLSFDMDIVTSYGTAPNQVSNHEIIPISIKLNEMGTSKWEQNHKYTYYIKIVPNQNKVLFDPALDADWVEGTTTDQTI